MSQGTQAPRGRKRSAEPFITAAAHKISPYLDGIHFHHGYEILLVVKGEIEVTVEKRSFRACAGTLIIFSNLESHRIRVLSKQYERYFLTLDTARCDKLLTDRELISLLKCRPVDFEHALSLGERADKVAALFEAILDEQAHTDRFSAELCEGYVKELLVLVHRALPRRAEVSEGRMRETLCDVREYLDNHFTEDIRIKSLCEQFYTDHFYLTHLFKEYTGYSPKQYLTRLRLSHATELFCSHEYTISRAALASGFTDVNNFIRAFRGEFGLTPTEYKRLHVKD